MFAVQYAALPWILLTTHKYLESKGRKNAYKNLLGFALITLLATPQAYAAHLWYAFFGVWLVSLGVSIFISVDKVTATKRSFCLVAVCLFVNAFWLLPNWYYIITSSQIPKESKQNRIYSKDFQMRNRENGVVGDVAINRGFYWDWEIYAFDRERTVKLMTTWRDHAVSYPLFYPVTLIQTLLAYAGMVLVIRKRSGRHLALLPFLLISTVLLLNNTEPFKTVFEVLTKVSVINELMRFVFNKFSMLMQIAITIYASYALAYIANKINGTKLIVTYAVYSLLLTVAFLPIWKGELISPRLKVAIPHTYFDIWDHMKTQPDGTMLVLPTVNFSGWQYYSWNYQGAGFVWFGMKQSVLDRDFDRWSPQNEQFYYEWDTSSEQRSASQLIELLHKYNIRYVLYDSSITLNIPKNNEGTLRKNFLHSFLKNSLVFKQVYTAGDKIIYEVQDHDVTKSKCILAGPQYERIPYDQQYSQLGTYCNSNANQAQDKRRMLISHDGKITQSGYQIESDGRLLFNNILTENGIVIDPIYRSFLQRENNHDPSKINISNQGVRFNVTNSSVNKTLIVPSSTLNSMPKIIALRSSNTSGLPLRVCIKQLFVERCSMFDEVRPSINATWSLFYFPQYMPELDIYIDVLSSSYGGISSVNTLEEVLVYETDLFKTSYNYNSKPFEEIPIYFHNSSEQKDFLAFNLTNSSILEKTLPLVFAQQKKLKDHVTVNGWANGWKLDQSKFQTSNSNINDNKNIVVVFWPQYLQYAGFAVLFLTIFWLVAKSYKENT